MPEEALMVGAETTVSPSVGTVPLPIYVMSTVPLLPEDARNSSG